MKLSDMPYEELVDSAINIVVLDETNRYKVELIKRLNDGEKAIELVKELVAASDSLKLIPKDPRNVFGQGTPIKREWVDRMQTAWNNSRNYCDKWQSDNLKREDRKI